MSDPSRTSLGAYQLAGLLGSGGMGAVYRAHDSKLGRDVAIKILSQAFAGDPDRVARLAREARLLASLNHPNIAAIYGLEEHDGIPALVLELVEGDTLAERIGRGPLPLGEALNIARQIAAALHAAHEKGIVHRDLKPSNIKITPARVVKVLDFGLAKIARPLEPSAELDQQATTIAAEQTQAGMILGTAAYMSPEQARGHAVDKQTDIWAFGCVLFEMLTGHAAFARPTITDTLAAVVNHEPDFQELPKALPAGLRRVLRRCLEKDPARRVHDIADAAIELEDIQEDQIRGVSATDRPSHRRRSPVFWAVLTLGALAVAAVTIYAMSVLRPREDTATVTRLSVSAPGQVTPQSAPAVSPEGRRIAFAAKDAAGRTMLWLRDLDALQPRALPETDDAAHPFWSPDGKAIGFLAGGRLKRLDVADGTVRTLSPQTTRFADTWGDGVILFPHQGIELAVMPASGGPSRPLGISGAWPSFLPDGHHFLYHSQMGRESGRRGISVGSIDSDESRFLLESDYRAIYAAPGFLLTVKDETLLAYPFDLDRLAVTGEPFVAADAVFSVRGPGQASVSVSPTGVLAYTNANINNTQVAAFDRTGRPLGPVTSPPDRSGNQSLRVSPSGRKLAMGRGRQGVDDSVWLFDLLTGAASRFIATEERSNTPLWSRDSSRLLFQSSGGSRRGVRFGVKNATGEGQEETLFEFPPPQTVGLWDWSPDGRHVVYTMSSPDTKGIGDLWVLPTEGERRPRPYLQSGFHKAQAQISPNGQWLAYTSFESGKDEVYIQSFPTAGSKRQVSTDGGMQPRWRADGSELFYVDRNGRLIAVPVKAERTFEAGPPTPLFQTKILPQGSQSLYFYTVYDASADGQKFFINAAADDPGPPITVVLNWTAARK